jgi:hypothetical protein
MRFLKFALLVSLILLGAGHTLRADVLKAGVSKVEITPPVGLPMGGYSERVGPANGVLDPLYARVLVLECGEKRLAIATLDLVQTFGQPLLQQLRESVKKSSGITYLIVAASHTHSGPAVAGDNPSNPRPEWEMTALEKVRKAIDAAHQSATEVRLGTGYGVSYIAHDRRHLNPDGTVTMMWRNPTRMLIAPFDPTVSVLRVDTAAGKPLAILVDYSCHPAVYGSDNNRYSADFPGVMTKTIEHAFDDQPLAFFLQGAAGDTDPDFDESPIDHNGESMCAWTGQQLGVEATRVAKLLQTKSVSDPDIEVREDVLPFHLRWNPEKGRQEIQKRIPGYVPSWARGDRDTWQLPITTVLINKQIALTTMPGEPFTEFQMYWRDRCPVHDAFFLGYANGYYGYIPTIRAAAEGSYGAGNYATWLEVGAGEQMLNRALIRVYEMLGRLTDIPKE